MSKRCELQKEYYKEFGNYKGDGKYSDNYVKWLENEVLALRLYSVSKCDAIFEQDVKLTREEIEEDCRNIPN